MAGCMTTTEMKKIQLDYNNKMNKLNEERESMVAAEYKRIGDMNKKAEEKIAEAKRQSEETKQAVNAIIETESEHSSSDSSGDGKRKPTNSDTAGPSAEKNGETNFSPSEDEQEPPLKTKKTLKRRIHQTKDIGSICTLLHSIQHDFSVLREENASIIRRLNALETPTEQPVANTNAETSQKGAFAALKVDWIPKILNMLALIYAEVQQSTDE